MLPIWMGFSSNMRDVYISRAGMMGKQLEEEFTHTELGVLKDELDKVCLRDQIKADRILALEQKMAAIEEHFSTIVELYANGLDADMVEAALRKKGLRH